jgi:hypothetical protein
VKTDFGFVLVEKDKIAAIIPTAPAGSATSKTEPPAEKKPAVKPKDKPEPAPQGPAASVAAKKESGAAAANSAPSTPPKAASADKKSAVAQPAPPRLPQIASPSANSKHAADPVFEKEISALPSPAGPTSPAIPVVTAVAPLAKPALMQPAVNRENVEGNVYTNYTHGFRMYKPPSWKLIDDARKTIPNAIVAMGTANESTLMVFAEEKSKKSLEETATDVEARLRDTYGNYRRISQRKTVAGGFPAIEIHYRGLADDHDWSGTLLIVSHVGEMFSIVGMTYSDTDLIQIQENVIARAIASLEFNSH